MDLSNPVINITSDCLTEEDIELSSIVSIFTLIMLMTSSTLFIAIVKRRRSTRLFEPFLLSIAISDFLLCLTTLPASVTFSFVRYRHKSVEDVSILCIVCGFSLLGLHSAKVLTYFAGSIDGYLMVSSRRYRKHFEVEIKSSIAVLLWVLAGVFQMVLISAGIGKHVYHCQLGVCIFQLTDSRVFVAVNSVNVIMVVFSLLATVAAIRKGRKRAIKVAPCENILEKHIEQHKVVDIEENIEMNNYQPQTNDSEEKLEKIIPLTNGCSTEMTSLKLENVEDIKDSSLLDCDKKLSSCTGRLEMFTSIPTHTKQSFIDKSVQTDLHFHEMLLMENERTNINNTGVCDRNCIEQDTYKEGAVGVRPRINSLHRGVIQSEESDVDSETYHCQNEPITPIVMLGDCELINIGDKSDISMYNIDDELERASNKRSKSVNVTVLDDTLKCIDEEPDKIMYANSFGTVRQNIRENLVPDRILLKCYSHAFAHGISLLIFIICWGPFHCVTILQSIFHIEIPTVVIFSLLWLGLTNGVWNVVIYPSLSSVLNKNIRTIWRQFCKQTN